MGYCEQDLASLLENMPTPFSEAQVRDRGPGVGDWASWVLVAHIDNKTATWGLAELLLPLPPPPSVSVSFSEVEFLWWGHLVGACSPGAKSLVRALVSWAVVTASPAGQCGCGRVRPGFPAGSA